MAQGKSMVSKRYNTTADKALPSGRSRRNNRTKTASTEPMPAGVGMMPARDWLKAVSEKHCKAVKGRDSVVEVQKTIQGMRYQVVNFNRLHRNRRRSRGAFNRDRLSACSWASLCPAPVSLSSQEGCFARRRLASRLQAVCIQGTVATANRTPAITQTPANPSRI